MWMESELTAMTSNASSRALSRRCAPVYAITLLVRNPKTLEAGHVEPMRADPQEYHVVV